MSHSTILVGKKSLNCNVTVHIPPSYIYIFERWSRLDLLAGLYLIVYQDDHEV